MMRILFLLFLSSPLWACSAFVSDCLVGKNYDDMADEGLLIINKAGVEKRALSHNPLCWVSKYGSAVFTQFGCELPTGGMNEAGLVVEMSWLDDACYPDADERPTVTELQWTQYQLDTKCSVEEVIESNSYVRIADPMSHVHYLVADRYGSHAVIEFLEGKLVVHDATVMTNDPYITSCLGKGAENSQQRFDKLSAEKPASVDEAFLLLKSAYNKTHWHIVYDLQQNAVHFECCGVPRRTVCLEQLDFQNKKRSVLDLMQDDGFEDYSTEINRQLIFTVYPKIDFLQSVPAEDLEELALYPESCR